MQCAFGPSPVPVDELGESLDGYDGAINGGTSLTGFWGGGALDHPPGDTLFAALDFNRRLPRFPPSPVSRGPMASIVLDSLHNTRNGDGAEELYHLGRDSWEVRNLVRDSSYAQALEAHRQALRTVRGDAGPLSPGR